MNLAQIEALEAGQWINHDLLGNGRWRPMRITRIAYRGVSIHGRAYVGFYMQLGEASQISGSVTEGDTRYFRVLPRQAGEVCYNDNGFLLWTNRRWAQVDTCDYLTPEIMADFVAGRYRPESPRIWEAENEVAP